MSKINKTFDISKDFFIFFVVIFNLLNAFSAEVRRKAMTGGIRGISDNWPGAETLSLFLLFLPEKC